jgi:hypothetical protein
MHRIILASALFLGTLLVAGPSFAAFTVTQPPCNPNPTFSLACSSFTARTSPEIVRSFTFNAPSAGVALVMFHGSVYCQTLHTSRPVIVDFVSQIVTSPTVAAFAHEPGGQRHSAVLDALGTAGTGIFAAQTFNLASTRAIPIGAAGANTVYFRMRRVAMDGVVTCKVYSPAFTVSFTP